MGQIKRQDFTVISSTDENAVFRTIQHIPNQKLSKKQKAKAKKTNTGPKQILTTLHYFSDEEIQKLKEIEESLIHRNYFSNSKSNALKSISHIVLKFLEIR